MNSELPRKSSWRSFFLPLALAGLLSSTLLLSAVTPASANTPCSVWTNATWTNGVTMWARGWIDCPANPQSDWVWVHLREHFGPFKTIQAEAINTVNNSTAHSTTASFVCENHGTDDWSGETNGKDMNGGQSGWIQGVTTLHTC
jgi:hypothetical protein